MGIQETELERVCLYKEKLTWRSFSHFNRCDSTRPQIALQEKTQALNAASTQKERSMQEAFCTQLHNVNGSYSVIICSIWVLVTGNDLGGHPIRGPDEGVSPPHRSIELSTHAKVD